MTDNRLKWMFVGLLALTLLSVQHSSAVASHYRLAFLEFVDPAQVEAYLAIGIETTEDLLVRALTQEERQTLSEETGISELEILVMARLCELLQIEGVGPSAAQLLRAGGVVSVEDLTTREPVELVERLAAVNAVEQLTGLDPSVENLTSWIAAANDVPYRIE